MLHYIFSYQIYHVLFVLPRRHTTLFQLWYDVIQCRTTSYQRWNDVTCLQGWSMFNKSTRYLTSSQLLIWLYTTLFLSLRAYSFILLKKALSVLPIQLLKHPGQQNWYTYKNALIYQYDLLCWCRNLIYFWYIFLIFFL